MEVSPEILPLPVLPEEIWLKILESVDKADGLWSCYDTCRQFRRLLREEQEIWRFPKAFLVLYTQVKFTPQDILNCRLVCKAWLEGIDNCLCGHPHLGPFDKDNLSKYVERKKTLKRWRPKYHYDEYQMLTRPFNRSSLLSDPHYFSNIVATTPEEKATLTYWKEWFQIIRHKRNPFLGRSISLQMNTSKENWHANGPNVTILTNLGKYIHHLKVNLLGANKSQVGINHFLNSCMEKVPNLRTLKLQGYFEAPQVVPEMSHLYPIKYFSWASSIECNQLETIEFHPLNVTSHGTEILSLLLQKYSTRLKKLVTSVWTNSLSDLPWPNLTELDLRGYIHKQTDGIPMECDDFCGNRQEYFEIDKKNESKFLLSSLLRINVPSLQSLSLQLYFLRYGDCTLQQVMEVTNHFPTLAMLRLNIEGDKDQRCFNDAESLPRHLTVPTSLRCLEMTHGNWISYNFLERFQSLRFLHLNGDVRRLNESSLSEVDELAEKIKVHEPLKQKKMRKSNIWTLLPHLQTISYEETQENREWKTRCVWEREEKTVLNLEN